MKKIKSLFACLFVLVFAFSLAACGSSSDDSSTAPDSTASSAEAGSTGDEEYAEDVQKIIDRGVLMVGVKDSVEGFGYQDPATSERSGMEISLAEKLAEQLGVDVEFTTVTAATRTELLDSGDIDCVIATFTITDERRDSWDFTTPYYTDHVTVLVENSSGIQMLADLEGKAVGVSSGSTSAQSLVEALIAEGLISEDGYNADTFDAATWTEYVSFQQYEDYPTISTALSANQIDAFCVDKSILSAYLTDARSYIDAEFAPQEYGIATTKDTGFSEYCEEFIQACFDDGTIDDLIAEFGLD